MVLSSWLKSFREFIWWIQASARRLPTLRPDQPTWVVSLPVGCHMAYIHHRHLLLLSPKAIYLFYRPTMYPLNTRSTSHIIRSLISSLSWTVPPSAKNAFVLTGFLRRLLLLLVRLINTLTYLLTWAWSSMLMTASCRMCYYWLSMQTGYISSTDLDLWPSYSNLY